MQIQFPTSAINRLTKHDSDDDAPYWMPSTEYFEECVAVAPHLMKIDAPLVAKPSREELREQWEYLEYILGDTGHFRFSKYRILGRTSSLPWMSLPWMEYFDLDSAKVVLASGSGSWAIVSAERAVFADGGDVPEDKVASNIADVLIDGGMISENIDKILCIGPISAVELSDVPDTMRRHFPVPVLYALHDMVEALLPRDCIEVDTSYYAYFKEPLYVHPGYARARFKPSPDAQSAIDAYYSNAWEERLVYAFDKLLDQIAPMELTKKVYLRNEAEVKAFVSMLCCDDDKTPDVLSEFENKTSTAGFARNSHPKKRVRDERRYRRRPC